MYIEPRILKESRNGVDIYEIRDEMLLHREIQCVGEINAESVNSMISQLIYLSRQEPEKEITMYINSPGGEVASGLALYDVMKAIRCPIRTVCVGTAASMGAVLFAAGNSRDILPHARVMIHDPLIPGGVGGSALQLKGISEDLMRTREILCRILAEHTHRTLEEIYEKTGRDTYFYADEAVEYGLADRVVEQFDQPWNEI
ncbi:MAG: ATP-dependent Clp protease proteolytic subunit [Lachnospiraceae bacterium]|nr:ATP-dependent Clp protease proteolytic subunit [Lachnospiraceae bacterium]